MQKKWKLASGGERFLHHRNRSDKTVISGDTGPLHFAAALGVPTISLFGPSLAVQWAPVGEKHHALTGGVCGCDGNSPDCRSARHCLAEITPQRVFAVLEETLRAS